MFSNIVKKKVKDLKLNIYEQLYNLNFRNTGIMRKELVAAKKHDKAIVCYITDKNKVVAWSILVENYYNTHRNKIVKAVKPAFYDFHVYVRKSYRRMGLGKQLYNFNNKICLANRKKISTVNHDLASTKFFNSLK